MDAHQEQLHVFQSKLCDDLSDEDYFTFVAYLSQWTKQELMQARGDALAERQALCRYYKRGEHAQLTPGELLDFLAVSSPNIFEEAGYDEAEGDRLMEISDALTDEKVDSIDLLEDTEEPPATTQLKFDL